MGLTSWRGKGAVEGQPTEVTESAVTSSYEADGVNQDIHLKRLKDQHRFDPFMDIAKLDAIDDAIDSGDLEKEAAVEHQLIEEDSPYAEVRAAVRVLLSLQLPALHNSCSDMAANPSNRLPLAMTRRW